VFVEWEEGLRKENFDKIKQLYLDFFLRYLSLLGTLHDNAATLDLPVIVYVYVGGIWKISPHVLFAEWRFIQSGVSYNQGSSMLGSAVYEIIS